MPSGNNMQSMTRHSVSSYRAVTGTRILHGLYWKIPAVRTWGAVNCYDHRTLQDAHDLLAAAWRFQDGGSYRQGKLSFAGEAPFDDVQVLWLNWLRHEVDGWTSSPHLVRSVQIILSNQNKPLGYMAESKLCLDIFDRFSNIPWDEKLYEAHEKDLYEEIAVS